jgi:hypothetical protein
MSAIEERISDSHVLKLLRAMLRSGVMEDGAVRRGVTGTRRAGLGAKTCLQPDVRRLWGRVAGHPPEPKQARVTEK